MDDAELPSDFSIEELSRRTGMTVRSLRSYQSRRLLPPPEVRGRTGYYDERHVARIELIKDLQSEGFKLESLSRMLDEGGLSDAELLRFTRSVRGMFSTTEGQIATVEDLVRRFKVDDLESATTVIARAEKLGLFRKVGDDSYEELAPRLIEAGEQAIDTLSLDLGEALDIVGQLRRHAEGVARLYLELYLTRVWTPFVEAGRPQERWEEVQEALDEVRSLATEALLGAFEVVMAERIEDTFDREFLRAPASSGKRKHRGSRM
jgi:DNA-binding transcriptional MerR regulator